MQTKINDFFKLRNPDQRKSKLKILPNSDAQSLDNSNASFLATKNACTVRDEDESESNIPKSGIDHYRNISIRGKIPKNKRSYAQLYLDLGQSDFTLHSCPTCGFKYSCGDDVDEKLHKEVHKEYTEGMPFKGWENERVISERSTDSGRIILVLDGDPPAHKKRVEKVMQMIEVDLGSCGNLIHELCKVYLYVNRRRIAGCLVVEPISEAYRVICKSETSRNSDNSIAKKSRLDSSFLQFGSISFQREAKNTTTLEPKHKELAEDLMGAIFLETEAVPANCGIRAIWVAPASRRKHIGTQLLDAARMSFSNGEVLDKSQLAFSDPTSTGKIFASRYCGTPFLAYKARS